MIEKIQKLLALSKSCNQAEAELAFSKAKALADKYGLDLQLAAIRNGTQAENEPFDHKGIFQGKLPVVHKYIVNIMQNYFKVKVVYSRGYRSTYMCFVGRRNDIEVAREVYNRLVDTFEYLWLKYKKENSLDNKCKASYMYGLKNGLESKLNEQEQQTKKESILSLPEQIQANCSQKLELMIMDERKQLTEALYKFYPRLRKGKASHYGDVSRGDVYSDGVRAGKTINTGSSQMCLA